MFQVVYVAHNLRVIANSLCKHDFMDAVIRLRNAAALILTLPAPVEEIREILLDVQLELVALPKPSAWLQELIGTLFNGGDEFNGLEDSLYPGSGRILA
jgi:hypothetical protein